MVGVGGGAPNLPKRDIRLGDIVVGVPRGREGGVIQYDFGKTIQDQTFELKGFLNQPPTVLRTAVSGLKAQYEADGHRLDEDITDILNKKPRLKKKYKRPDPSSDRLLKAEAIHGPDCEVACGNDPTKLIMRPERTDIEDNPSIHYGLIASANQLMKDARVRDKLAAEKDVLCFEMEAAGLMNHFPCLVIRGICDYSDSHKNKEWQGYAAMAAAAYAKDLLKRIKLSKIEAEKIISEIQEDVKKLLHKQDSDGHGALLEWLTPIDYAAQQNDFISRRHKETGRWLLDSTQYSQWLEQSGTTLFCPGMPGAGKTILTSVVVQDLYAKFENDSTIGIAYLYCNYKRRHEQKPIDLLLSLLKQFVQMQPSTFDHVAALHDRHQKKRTRPLLDEILVALHSVMAEYGRTFIIIDALDELNAGNAGSEHIRSRKLFLSEILSLKSKDTANIFATSRFNQDIEKTFRDCLWLEIRASDEDVGRYLDSHMSILPFFVSKRPDLQKEIKVEIAKAVDGMFLLAQLHLNSVVGSRSAKHIKDALKRLTKGSEAYDTAYSETMQRIEGQVPSSQKLAKDVLSWITCAKRLLTTSELRHALAVEIDATELDKDNLSEIQDIVSVCAGLVTVDEESHIVRLVHYTTQEYLERTQEKWFPTVQRDIATICVTYLLFNRFEQGCCEKYEEFEERLEQNPLYEYAAQNWGYHVLDASLQQAQLILDFLQSVSKMRAAGQALNISGKYFSASNFKYFSASTKEMTAAHLAVRFGLNDTVEGLINNGHAVDAQDDNGRTPLSYAAEGGYEAVVKILLAKNAVNPDSIDYYERTPLSYAAEGGYKAVVDLLLAQDGVEINSEFFNANYEHFYDGLTPLRCAAQKGHESVVKLLLDRGADLCCGYNRAATPLSDAAKNGHDRVVKLLLDAGADVNMLTWEGTPLSYAAMYGHEVVVRLLLANGANPNLTAERRPTPLCHVARTGNLAMAELLLENGAKLEPNGNWLHSPLRYAAEEGHEAMVNLLMAKHTGLKSNVSDVWATLLCKAAEDGSEALVKRALARDDVNPNSKGSRAQTPLFYAAENGHGAVVKLLLENGAEPDSKDRYNLTPLYYAAKNGYEAVVKLLLENNAEPDSKDILKRTPLSCAAENGHGAVVKLMLENGVDPNWTDDKNRNLLSWAASASAGNMEVVELLCEKDVDYDLRDKYGRNPLSYAAENGHERMVRLLLDKNKEPDSKDNSGRTPLSRAAEHGQEIVVELLLQNGASPDSRDDNGRVPLSYAAKRGHTVVAKLLLAKLDVDPDSEDNDGRTVLSIAANAGHEEIVRLLLEMGVSKNSSDKQGRTPLSYATMGGHYEVVKLLLAEDGVDPNSKDNDDRTPLSWAVGSEYEGYGEIELMSRLKVVKLLLAQDGVDPDSKDCFGRTPFSRAAEKRYKKILSFLLAQDGVNPNSTDNNGRTPLSLAISPGDMHERFGIYEGEKSEELVLCIAKFFLANLNNSVDPDTKDKDGLTPLSYAARKGFKSVVELLLEKGANRESKDHLGRTPLLFAAEKGYEEIVKLLLAKGAVDLDNQK
ncbi:Ankyrin-1 [Arthrobotrys entomopaga]|nr:Ankyrin-1 [Arthrobotrys entomopaga]